MMRIVGAAESRTGMTYPVGFKSYDGVCLARAAASRTCV